MSQIEALHLFIPDRYVHPYIEKLYDICGEEDVEKLSWLAQEILLQYVAVFEEALKKVALVYENRYKAYCNSAEFTNLQRRISTNSYEQLYFLLEEICEIAASEREIKKHTFFRTLAEKFRAYEEEMHCFQFDLGHVSDLRIIKTNLIEEEKEKPLEFNFMELCETRISEIVKNDELCREILSQLTLVFNNPASLLG